VNDHGKRVSFGLFDRLGWLPYFDTCKTKKMVEKEKMLEKDKEKGNKTEVSEMAQEIGIGPTMFLMSTKSLSMFFLLLTLINLSLMFIY
jgi:hypothetical protein